jgi:hypothetical protein
MGGWCTRRWMARQMCDVASAVKAPSAFTVRVINRSR